MHRVPLALLGRAAARRRAGLGAIHGLSVADASPARRAEAPALLQDGGAWGTSRAPAKQPLTAIEVDPAQPEAYNGVRVTHRMRNDLDATDEDRNLASLHGEPASWTLVKALP